MINRYRCLPLENLPNARDLGGYAVPGGVTRCGVFLRTAAPDRLSEHDITFLRGYGVMLVVDLRGDDEL